MRAKGQAAASCPHAEQAALGLLSAGGSAVDAVVGSFFATAAVRAGGLLCPVVALVAGVGVGARMIDGRCLQPGHGLRRPRGIRQGEPVPAAADAAVSRSVAAALLLHAYGGSLSIAQLLRPAQVLAAAQGCSSRSALLKSIGARGSAALRSPEVGRAIIGHAGPAEGGLLTEQDLAEARPDDVAAQPIEWGESQQLVVPGFQSPEGPSPAARPAAGPPTALPQQAVVRAPYGLIPEVVVAADGHGVVAALAYCPDDGGLELPELQLCLPRGAIPVRRSVARVKPGSPLPAPAPIGIAQRPAEGWFAAMGITCLERLPVEPAPKDMASLHSLLERFARGPRSGLAVAASVQRYRTGLTRIEIRPD